MQRVARGYLLNMGHHAHVVMVDVLFEPRALVEGAAKDGTWHAQRRAADLHSRRGEGVQGAKTFDGADGTFASHAHRLDAGSSIERHERDDAALQKIDLHDLLCGLMKQVAREETHVAKVGPQQGQIVLSKAGEKPVTNWNMI